MKKKKEVTLSDIAKKANVSKSTVSRALNNYAALPSQTIKRIQSLAQKMGYRPNPFATFLAHQKKGSAKSYRATLACVVGVEKGSILEYANNHKVKIIFEAMKKRAFQNGYHLESFWCFDPEYQGKKLNRILKARGIPGVILISVHESKLQLDWEKFSVVYAYQPYEPPRFSYVSIDYFEATHIAVTKMLERGYRKIGLALLEWIDFGVRHRISSAYQSVLAQHGLKSEEKIPVHYWNWIKEPDRPKTHKNLLKWMTKYEPEVIISSASNRNTYVQSVLDKEGTAFVNLDVPLSGGKIAGIHQQWEETGTAAIDLLVGALNRNEKGYPRVAKGVMLEPKWIEGRSVKKRK